MNKKSSVPQKMLVDSQVKSAILYLTSNQIPHDENFDFVLEAMSEFEPKECREFLFENFYDEILEWNSFNAF
jgi:hypothetical protein